MRDGINHYDHFIRLVSDVSIDDLLAVTEGYQKSIESINAVNKWIMEKLGCERVPEEFEDIFRTSLTCSEALWFNLGWRSGWSCGALEGLQKCREGTPGSSIHHMPVVIYSSPANT